MPYHGKGQGRDQSRVPMYAPGSDQCPVIVHGLLLSVIKVVSNERVSGFRGG
jgi:hypothetical protein